VSGSSIRYPTNLLSGTSLVDGLGVCVVHPQIFLFSFRNFFNSVHRWQLSKCQDDILQIVAFAKILGFPRKYVLSWSETLVLFVPNLSKILGLSYRWWLSPNFNVVLLTTSHSIKDVEKKFLGKTLVAQVKVGGIKNLFSRYIIRNCSSVITSLLSAKYHSFSWLQKNFCSRLIILDVVSAFETNFEVGASP
jgi:hypothetical protein